MRKKITQSTAYSFRRGLRKARENTARKVHADFKRHVLRCCGTLRVRGQFRAGWIREKIVSGKWHVEQRNSRLQW